MIRSLIFAALLCGCQTRRGALAPGTGKAQAVQADQRSAVADAAHELREQVADLRRSRTATQRMNDLAAQIEHKATILLESQQ